jgi:hypothetical protein
MTLSQTTSSTKLDCTIATSSSRRSKWIYYLPISSSYEEDVKRTNIHELLTQADVIRGGGIRTTANAGGPSLTHAAAPRPGQHPGMGARARMRVSPGKSGSAGFAPSPRRMHARPSAGGARARAAEPPRVVRALAARKSVARPAVFPFPTPIQRPKLRFTPGSGP